MGSLFTWIFKRSRSLLRQARAENAKKKNEQKRDGRDAAAIQTTEAFDPTLGGPIVDGGTTRRLFPTFPPARRWLEPVFGSDVL